jgi:O-antigen ligase
MMLAAGLSSEDGWPDRLRRGCLWLFAFVPAVLLFSRTGAEIMIAVIDLSFLAVVFARRRFAVFAVPVVAILIAIWLYLMAVNAPLAYADTWRVFHRGFFWLRFWCLFAAVVFWLFRDARDFEKLAIVWGATLAFCIVDSLVQGFFGASLSGRGVFERQRLTGPLDRPNIGRFTVFLFYPAVAAYLLVREKTLDGQRIAALAAGMLLAIFFVVFTAERGATLLAFATFFGALLLLMIYMPKMRWPGIILIVLSVVITYATIWYSTRLQIRVAPSVGVARDFWKSEYGELILIALSVWRQQPITGVGLGNFDVVCNAVEQNLIWGCLRHPHNIYLEWLSEAGVIGLAGFVVFAGLVAALVLPCLRFRKERPLAVALVIACPVLTLFPLVPGQSFFSNWPAMLWWSSLSLTCAVAVHLRARAQG